MDYYSESDEEYISTSKLSSEVQRLCKEVRFKQMLGPDAPNDLATTADIAKELVVVDNPIEMEQIIHIEPKYMNNDHMDSVYPKIEYCYEDLEYPDFIQTDNITKLRKEKNVAQEELHKAEKGEFKIELNDLVKRKVNEAKIDNKTKHLGKEFEHTVNHWSIDNDEELDEKICNMKDNADLLENSTVEQITNPVIQKLNKDINFLQKTIVDCETQLNINQTISSSKSCTQQELNRSGMNIDELLSEKETTVNTKPHHNVEITGETKPILIKGDVNKIRAGIEEIKQRRMQNYNDDINISELQK